ncbi:hypothetical protein OOJ09_31455 [Mesorhizobium qingshengii]|uniref:Uncharacterized protein n=1 Tax=Mesorhizobium qingshengii TaxID=1165689 RepID=A0ABT4R4Y9_9HYPH|nr:hypothetical protein [Mesorhizobium qingshengii]MCZ8548694.1 hypothetical protein [Mesorhizobium qingshengii]
MIFDADPERVRATTDFIADQLRTFVDRKAYPFSPLQAALSGAPYRATVTTGECALATMQAFAVVTAELVDQYTQFAHDPYEDEDYYDDLESPDVAKLLARIERDIERRSKGESPRWPNGALTSTLTELLRRIDIEKVETDGDTLARVQLALDSLATTSKAA